MALSLKHFSLPSFPSLSKQPPWTVAAWTVALTLGVAPILSYAITSYRGFMALGPGGIPHNVFGWMVQGIFQLIARHDVRSAEPMTKPHVAAQFTPHGDKTFFDTPLPERVGERPDVPGYVVPQRQMSDRGPEGIRDTLIAFFTEIQQRNPGLLEQRPSELEGQHTPALWVVHDEDKPLASYLQRTKGEVSHVHPETGRQMDDVAPCIQGFDWLSDADKQAIFEGNARKVFRLEA